MTSPSRPHPLARTGAPTARRAAGVVALALLGSVALVGCTGSTHSSSKSSTAAGMAVPAPAAPVAEKAASAAGSAGGSDSQGTSVGTQATDRSVVRTASIDLVTPDVDRAATAIDRLATSTGGRLDTDQRSAAGTRRTAQLILRVPPARLDATIAAIDALGHEQARHVQAVDVTTTKADDDARVAALATSVTRLRQLLARSASLKDLLAVETQLTDRQSDLDAMRASQAALADQISLARVTVNLRVPAAIAAAGHGFRPTGFLAAVANGFHAVVLSARVGLAAVGYALPIAVPLAVLALLYVIWRRRRTTGGPVDEPAPTAV